MGFSLSSTITTQTGNFTSQTVTAVDTQLDINRGSITSNTSWATGIVEGQAFVIQRAGTVIGVRCVESVSNNVINYYRLYVGDGANRRELETDIQAGDTISLCEQPNLVGNGNVLNGNGGTLTTNGLVSTISMGNNSLRVSGFMQLPERLLMEWVNPSTTQSSAALHNSSTGLLVLGQYKTVDGVSQFTSETIMRGGAQNTTYNRFFLATNTSLGIHHFGGKIFANVSFGTDGQVNCPYFAYSKQATFKSSGAYTAFRLPNNFTSYGITLDSVVMALIGSNPQIAGADIYGSNAALSPSGSSPNDFIPVGEINLKLGVERAELLMWQSKKYLIYNHLFGSDFRIASNSLSNTSSNRGLAEVRQAIAGTIKSAAGVPISGAKIFMRDKNNGGRLAANVINGNPDYIADRTYYLTSNASGEVSYSTDYGVLIAVKYQNAQSQSISGTTNVVEDYRGDLGTNADQFTFGYAAYGYLPSAVPVVLKSTSAVSISTNLSLDQDITQTDAAIVASYTSLETREKLYDYAQLWLTLSSENQEKAGLGNKIAEKDGDYVNLGGYDVVFDPTLVNVFSVSGNTINIKAITNPRIKTTGTVTFQNGATVANPYISDLGSLVTIRTADNAEVSSYVVVDGTPLGWVNLSTARNIFVQPSSVVNIYAHAYGKQPVLQTVTGSTASDYVLSFVPEVHVDITQTDRDTIASAFSVGVDGSSRIFLSVNTDLRDYTPAQVLHALHWFVLNNGTIIGAAAIQAGDLNGFGLIQGGFAIRTAGFYAKVADSVTTTSDLGILIPLAIYIDPNVYTVMPTYTPVMKNASGIVLQYAPWTQQQADVNTAQISGSVWSYPTREITQSFALESTAQEIKTKVDTLDNYDDTTLQGKVDTVDTVVDSIKTKVDTLNNYDETNVIDAINNLNDFDPTNDVVSRVTLVDTVTTNTDMRGTDNAITSLSGVALESTSQSIKTKVDTLENTDLTTTDSKIDEVKAVVDTIQNYDDTTLIGKIDVIDANVDAILVDTNELQTNQGNWVTATGFATPTNVTDAQTAIVTEINANETKIDIIDTVVDAIKVKTDTLVNADFTATNTLINNLNDISLAEIEGSAILAKESTSQTINTKVQSLSNYNATVLESKVDVIDTVVDAIKAKTDQITFTGSNLNAIAQVVGDKTGYELTSGERTAIAVAVEQAILNDGDGQAILNAIVGAIGNQNVDEIALVAAIRADMERTGGMLETLPTLSEIETSTVLAKEATNQTINTKVQSLSNYNDTVLQGKVDVLDSNVDLILTNTTDITTDLDIINNGVKKASLLIPHTTNL